MKMAWKISAQGYSNYSRIAGQYKKEGGLTLLPNAFTKIDKQEEIVIAVYNDTKGQVKGLAAYAKSLVEDMYNKTEIASLWFPKNH